jgi:Family of unknown function (DUF5760)
MAQLDRQELATLVRNWVHQDTLVSQLNKEVGQARAARDQYEERILGLLRRANLENAVLQIAGGRLLVADDRHSQPLTFKTLESLLHAYFLSKPTSGADETAAILKYIRENRSVDVSKRLKRQTTQV